MFLQQAGAAQQQAFAPQQALQTATGQGAHLGGGRQVRRPRPSDRAAAGEARSGEQAERLDPSAAMAEDELLIEVESLNIDSASFHQISEACRKDSAAIGLHIQNLVANFSFDIENNGWITS